MHVIALVLAILASIGGCHGRPRPPCSDGGSIHTLCGFQNPEDLEYVERAGIVVVSNMRSDAESHAPGFLAAFVPDGHEVVRIWPRNELGDAKPETELGEPMCVTPPRAETFRPHGITSGGDAERTMLFVTGHADRDGGREAVEIFTLSGSGPEARLTWNACIPTPRGVQANDVAIGTGGEIVISNYQPDGSRIHTLKASVLGSATGDVMVWRRGQGWSHVPGTHSALANGVALSVDGKMLFYSESMTGNLHRLPLDGSGGAIAVEVEGNPDNLSWTKDGTLLLASHTAGYGFAACLFGKRPCTTSWAVFEIDPNTLTVKKILAHDGTLVGAVSTALQVGRSLLLGSVFDDRIGIVEVTRERNRTAPLATGAA